MQSQVHGKQDAATVGLFETEHYDLLGSRWALWYLAQLGGKGRAWPRSCYQRSRQNLPENSSLTMGQK